MRKSLMLALLPAALLVGALLVPGTAAAAAKHTQRVSVSSAGDQSDNGNYAFPPSVSANGRYVAFDSEASTLVSNDTNATFDVFVRDLKRHTTIRVSVGPGGAQGNDVSIGASISANGRYVAFSSYATNLVAGDTNGYADVFVRDLKRHTTTLVSVGPGGVQGNGSSELPAISANGRYVTYFSSADNLVSGDTNGYGDVFVRDLKLHKTSLVSVGPGGVQGDSASYEPSISANGRYVAFVSDATNLVSGDTNNQQDIFVRDRTLHKTVRVSVSSAGVQGDQFSYAPSISANGRYVAFSSDATTLVKHDTNTFRDIFVRDLKLRKTSLVSVTTRGVQGNGGSDAPAISADGRWVAFTSQASDLVAGDINVTADIFLRDRAKHRTTLVSVSSAGVQGNGLSEFAAISGDGRYVSFKSAATNLVPGDTNGFADIFVRWPLH